MSMLAIAFSVIVLASAGFVFAFKRWVKKLNTEVIDLA